jgi:hypothetical protein
MSNIKLFQTSQVRTQWNDEEKKWYFAIVDVIEILTESVKPRDYWYRLKQREKKNGIELSTNCRQLKMKARDGKMRDTEIADTETLLRIIQSIPSPKAEPFKRWLAKVGYERLEEIENPELATKRTKEIYKTKGYSDDWIEKRMRSIAIRDELTDEWKKRGVRESIEYAILTAEISKATFGLTPSQYKNVKGLKRENLRDHMTDLELIFSMLGEASTTKVAKAKDAKGFVENKSAARIGGKIAGNARKELEEESGEEIISSENYLPVKKTKKLRDKKSEN